MFKPIQLIASGNSTGTVTAVIKEKNTKAYSYTIVVGTQALRGDANFSSLKGFVSYFREVGEGSKLMFVHQALRKMNLNREICYEFLICKDSYTQAQLKAIQNTVKSVYKGTFVTVKNSGDITAYINTGTILSLKNLSSFKQVSAQRAAKPIKRLLFYVHGVVGELSLGINSGMTGSVYNIGETQVKNFDKKAFADDAVIYSYACRTGLGNPEVDKSIYRDPEGNKKDPDNMHNLLSSESLAQKLANQTKATVYAYVCRSDYEETLFTRDELCFA